MLHSFTVPYWYFISNATKPAIDTDTDTEFYYTLAAISRIAE